MSCRGVRFALGRDDVETIRSFAKDSDRLNFVLEHVEEELYDTDRAASSDKSGDAMHRALSGGYLTWDGGTYPLNHTVLGGELLYSGDDFIMSLKSPSQVSDVAGSLADIDLEAFRKLYFAIPADDYDAALDEQDCEYTWSWFEEVREFFQRAATEGTYVLFTADQ